MTRPPTVVSSRWFQNLSLALVVVAGLILPAAARAGEVYDVRIPAKHLPAGERVVGFTIEVKGGRIVSLPDLPIGWTFTIENEPSWNTRIKASIIVGAAALEPKWLESGFMVIQSVRAVSDKAIAREKALAAQGKATGTQGKDAGGAAKTTKQPVLEEVTAEVVTTADFDTQHKHSLKKEQLVFTSK